MYDIIISPSLLRLLFVGTYYLCIALTDSASALQPGSISMHRRGCARVDLVNMSSSCLHSVPIPLRSQTLHLITSETSWSFRPPKVPGMVLGSGGLTRYMRGCWRPYDPPGQLSTWHRLGFPVWSLWAVTSCPQDPFTAALSSMLLLCQGHRTLRRPQRGRRPSA